MGNFNSSSLSALEVIRRLLMLSHTSVLEYEARPGKSEKNEQNSREMFI